MERIAKELSIMAEDPKRCPKCDADFQGEPIPKNDQHLFGATHFSRLIGISDGDSVGWWRCPDCQYQWERGGYFAALARQNMAKE